MIELARIAGMAFGAYILYHLIGYLFVFLSKKYLQKLTDEARKKAIRKIKISSAVLAVLPYIVYYLNTN